MYFKDVVEKALSSEARQNDQSVIIPRLEAFAETEILTLCTALRHL
eukprot:CAMPEP_0179162218 /NCGR_PEP_ID=MMETSP0796-20121207/79455_1 /TAXON_ID=73915 /ORGANISM="Pyrodinium bahamense, Strain pbaha01" /LENGTH=45 /DNA_ID= /DNA_START= /DNA_END= /DNA_ORIENTATION=